MIFRFVAIYRLQTLFERLREDKEGEGILYMEDPWR